MTAVELTGVVRPAEVKTRAAAVPSALVFADSDQATARALIDVAAQLELRRPLFVFGREGRALIGRSLLIDCREHLDCAVIDAAGACTDDVARIGAGADEHGCDAVVACGGGQALDAGKYAAFQAGVPFVSVPTQATHDGICSPVAVLRDAARHQVDSYGARPPAALVVPMHVVARAPRRTIVTGMSDLASNLIAVEDWRWAREVSDEPFDDYAALLSRTAAQLVVSRRHLFAPDTRFTREDVEGLVHGLVLSGLAMTLAGSSRPCSGPEHLISHAFDRLRLGTGTHGEQVAVGCALAAELYDADLVPVLELLRNIGAPMRPGDLGIGDRDALRAIEVVPVVRPGRRSRLSAAVVADPAFVRELATATWQLQDGLGRELDPADRQQPADTAR